MLTEQTIQDLEALIDGQPEPAKSMLRAALDDVARVIAVQAMMLRNMRFELDNANVSIHLIEGLITEGHLRQLLANLSPLKRNAFTISEAKAACEALVAKVESATDFADILGALVQVGKVFI